VSVKRWFDTEWCAVYIGNTDCVCDLPKDHEPPCVCKCHPRRGVPNRPLW
jgi:hypothetical protein